MNAQDKKELELLEEIRYYIIEHRAVINILKKYKSARAYQQKARIRLEKLKRDLKKFNRMIKAIRTKYQ